MTAADGTSTPGAPPPARTPPELRGELFGGVARRMKQDPLETLDAAARLGEVVLVRAGRQRSYLLREPEHVQRVLRDHHRNYAKQTRPYHRARTLLGDGLVNIEGDAWLARRRLVQPTLHRQALDGHAQVMVRVVGELVGRLQASADAGQLVDISAEMTRNASSVLAATLFDAEPPELPGLTREWCGLLGERMSAPWVPPLWLPTAKNRRARRLIATVDALVQDRIARAREAGEPRGDILSMLVCALHAGSGEALTDRELRDEVVTFLLAGSETTAAALTWTFYLLASHPEAYARLRDELASVVGERSPTPADVDRLPYARMVLDEAMRLYPPLWSISRRAVEDDVIGGYRIPAGAEVLVSPWVTHRLPHLWDRPEEFVPERFLPERAEAMPRFAYFPFLGGPRQCVGARYAIVEALLTLATVAQRFRFMIFPLFPVRIEPGLTLRPRLGLHVVVKNA